MIFHGECEFVIDPNNAVLYITMPIKKLTASEVIRIFGKKAMARVLVLE